MVKAFMPTPNHRGFAKNMAFGVYIKKSLNLLATDENDPENPFKRFSFRRNENRLFPGRIFILGEKTW